jgi:hypothetical protein
MNTDNTDRVAMGRRFFLEAKDARTVTERLVGKLHLAMMQETDPELRKAYAESIAALRRNERMGTTAVE